MLEQEAGMEKNEIFRKSNLERISSPEKMNDYIKVINPSVILMLLALGLLLIGGCVWGFLGNIPQTASLTGAFYSSDGSGPCDRVAAVVSVETAAKLEAGMQVQVSPDAVDRDTYGYMKGKIESVGQYPAGKEEVLDLVHNEQLADYLMPGDVGMLVVIAMDEDSSSASGILWSGEKGQAIEVKDGATCSALAITKNQKPIELILGD